MKKSSIKFPTNLPALREMAGLNQYDIARALGCDRSRVSEIENGHTAPRPEELAGILKTIRAAHQRRVQEFERGIAGAEAEAA
jgi:transcriptional regulator with XRE-family HTH domain